MQIQMATEFCDMRKTIEMGQFFRYDKLSDSKYLIYARDQVCRISIEKTLVDIKADDIDFWINYFDLATDYRKINQSLAAFALSVGDNYGYKCCLENKGIRIARQDYIETCIEYMCSAQNTVRNIQNIIKNLCEEYGEEQHSKCLNISYHAFPTIKRLKSMTIADFESVKAGFRSSYIVEFIKNPSTLSVDDSYKEIMARLMNHKGIGPKVAACIALYSLRQLDAFPIDGQIKKALEMNYNTEHPFVMPPHYAGVLQAYMYWDIRH